MEQFTQEMLKRLDALASKLGMAASAIWGFYIRQARIDGLTYAIVGGILLLLAAANIGLIVFLLTKKKEYVWGQKTVGKGDRRTPDYNRVEFEYEFRTNGNPLILWWCAPILPLLAFASMALYTALTALYNPGYYAFQQIVLQLHGQ